MKNNKLNIILIIINICAFYYLKKEIGTAIGLFDLYFLIPLILLGIFFNKIKYLIWSIFFIGSTALVLYDKFLINTHPCSNIGCGINAGGLFAVIIICSVTGILLLIQLIQYLIKRNKKKNPAGEIRYPYEIK